jgi:2,4-dichlorophenol 6-monooxygenase
LLVAGEHGDAWCNAARHLAVEAGVPIDAVRIGHVDGDLFDTRCAWVRAREIDDDGAVLVRPDRFVGWRAASASDDPCRDLVDAVGQILGRAVDRPVALAHH